MDTDLVKVQKKQSEESFKQSSFVEGGDWHLIADNNIQIVLDTYTYIDIPRGLEYYMDLKSLRCLMKMPDDKYSRFIIETHFNSPNVPGLRYLYKNYVQENIRYNKNWCFGILFKDSSLDHIYTICTVKAINMDDFVTFTEYLLKYTEKEKLL